MTRARRGGSRLRTAYASVSPDADFQGRLVAMHIPAWPRVSGKQIGVARRGTQAFDQFVELLRLLGVAPAPPGQGSCLVGQFDDRVPANRHQVMLRSSA